MATKAELREELEFLGVDVPADATKAELEDLLDSFSENTDDGPGYWDLDPDLGEGRDPWWNRG